MDALLLNQMAVKYHVLDEPITHSIDLYTYDIRINDDCPFLKHGFKKPSVLVSSDTIEEAIKKAEKIIDYTLGRLDHYEPGLEYALEGYICIDLEAQINGKWSVISSQPLSTLRFPEVLNRYKEFEKSYEEAGDGRNSV